MDDMFEIQKFLPLKGSQLEQLLRMLDFLFFFLKSRLFLFLSCLYNNLSNFNRKLHRPIRLSWISCWYWGEVWTLILCWRWISWLLTRWIKALIEWQQSGDLIYIAEMTWLIYQKNFKKLIWLTSRRYKYIINFQLGNVINF